jgi:hypothetical protein
MKFKFLSQKHIYKIKSSSAVNMVGLAAIALIKSFLNIKTFATNGTDFIFSVQQFIPFRVAKGLNASDPVKDLYTFDSSIQRENFDLEEEEEDYDEQDA